MRWRKLAYAQLRVCKYGTILLRVDMLLVQKWVDVIFADTTTSETGTSGGTTEATPSSLAAYLAHGTGVVVNDGSLLEGPGRGSRRTGRCVGTPIPPVRALSRRAANSVTQGPRPRAPRVPAAGGCWSPGQRSVRYWRLRRSVALSEGRMGPVPVAASVLPGYSFRNRSTSRGRKRRSPHRPMRTEGRSPSLVQRRMELGWVWSW